MLDGWSIATETTGGIVALESYWDGGSLTLSYPTGINIPGVLVKKTFGNSKQDLVHIYHNIASFNSDVRIIENGEIRSTNCKSDVIRTYVPNRDACKTKTPKELINPYQNKFIELLVKITKIAGDIKAIHLDSGVYSLYSMKTFSENGYELTKKQDLAGDPYYYTKSSSGIELMFESDIDDVPLEMNSTIIRCPANNTLTAETIIQLINKLDNGNGSCSPLTFALFREIAKN